MGKIVSRNVAFVNAAADLDKYLKLIFSYMDEDSNYETKERIVNVFKDREYKISFYNPDKHSYETLTGLVVDFAGTDTTPAIILKYFDTPKKDNECCPTHDHSTCDCILADDKTKDKYASPKFITIPAFSINNIIYIGPLMCATMPDSSPKPIKRKGVRYLLLGINANILKLMMVNLDFIDDKFEDAFKSINLKIGGKYNIVYTSNDYKDHCNGTIYEIEGTLVNIEEVCNSNNNSSCIVRMNNCEHPEEIVGVHNSIYCNCDVSSDKDKFLTGESCDMDIKLTFDTMTSPISGSYDIVYLSQIRDVDVIDDNIDVDEDSDDITTGSGCESATNSNCACCQSKKTEYIVDGITYIYENGMIRKLDENGCPCSGEEYSMEELIGYFFGDSIDDPIE